MTMAPITGEGIKPFISRLVGMSIHPVLFEVFMMLIHDTRSAPVCVCVTGVLCVKRQP